MSLLNVLRNLGQRFLFRHPCNGGSFILAHHTQIGEYLREQKLFYSLFRHFYWPSVGVDSYSVVENCVLCAWECHKRSEIDTKLKLFPATKPPANVSIDIFGPPMESNRSSKALLVTTVSFLKITQILPLPIPTESNIAKVFTKQWVFFHNPLSKLFLYSGMQITSRSFLHVCCIFSVLNLYTTTYHPQTNGQSKRFDQSLLSALHYRVAYHPCSRNEYTDALTYVYNTKPHSSTSYASLALVLASPPHVPYRNAPP